MNLKKNLLIGLMLCSSLLLGACAPSGSGGDTKPNGQASDPSESNSSSTDDTDKSGRAYHKITAEEAKKMMDDGDVTVVDVRTAEEYAEAHIPGAVLVPNESIGNEPPEALPDKGAVLLVHCRTGIRSKQASDKLVSLGYTSIYDFGGIVDWPYETESGEAK